MLISETVEMFLNPSRAEEARSHMQFLLRISDKRWFEDNFEIFRSELRIWPRKDSYYFMKIPDEHILKERIATLTSGGTFTSEAVKAITEGNTINRGKMDRLRSTGAQMRRDISDKLREINRPTKDIRESWNDFLMKNLAKFGNDLLIKHAYHTKCLKWVSIKRWEKNPDAFPFFKEWVAGMLYVQYYAMKNQNDRLDKNAQSDIQHLLYLKMADGIVSEEIYFMQSAYNDLYAPKGKQYYSVADLDKLNSMGSVLDI